MVAQASFDADLFGSARNPFQAYFKGLDVLAQGFAPLAEPFKLAARCQIEVLSLANRRAQAYLAAPSRFAACRTPQDVVREQMRFWQTAFDHYSDSSRRIVETWGQMAALAQGSGAGPRRERDYITFPNTEEPPVPQRTIRLQDARRRVA